MESASGVSILGESPKESGHRSSRIERKEQMIKMDKILTGMKDTKEKGDLSVLRPSITTSVTGLRQALLTVNKATPEIRNILLNESNLIHECKVCLNMFRSTVSFISHKRTYCQLRYHQTRHKDVRECADVDDSDDLSVATVYVVPEDPVETVASGPDPDFDPDLWSPSIALMTEAGIINEIENRPLFNQLRQSRKTIEKVASKLKGKVDSVFDADYYKHKAVRLEHMRQSKNAVFQTMGLGGPSMGERYQSWQVEKQKPTHFICPHGKTLDPGETSSLCHSDSSSKENHLQQSREERKVVLKYVCFKCHRSFVETRSLRKHLRKKHDLDLPSAMEAAKKAKRKKFVVRYDAYGKVVSSKPLTNEHAQQQRNRVLDMQLARALKPCHVPVEKLSEAEIRDWTSPKPASDPFVSRRTLMKKQISPKRSPLAAVVVNEPQEAGHPAEEGDKRPQEDTSLVQKDDKQQGSDAENNQVRSPCLEVKVQLSPITITDEFDKLLRRASSASSEASALNPIDLNPEVNGAEAGQAPAASRLRRNEDKGLVSSPRKRRIASPADEGDDEVTFTVKESKKVENSSNGDSSDKKASTSESDTKCVSHDSTSSSDRKKSSRLRRSLPDNQSTNTTSKTKLQDNPPSNDQPNESNKTEPGVSKPSDDVAKRSKRNGSDTPSPTSSTSTSDSGEAKASKEPSRTTRHSSSASGDTGKGNRELKGLFDWTMKSNSKR